MSPVTCHTKNVNSMPKKTLPYYLPRLLLTILMSNYQTRAQRSNQHADMRESFEFAGTFTCQINRRVHLVPNCGKLRNEESSNAVVTDATEVPLPAAALLAAAKPTSDSISLKSSRIKLLQ
ncbi:hypothetical protein G7K_4868-t1 [Saitoella complicata NRRL Y-17804]|uniref:Uncharacterized protein n=1 Tax=Saitoella complicata (strain BCRC 22490 / CBS 7301 / JCM 7358 / NBRC 10748 / NRRL Y-17804) TaxID=698492 RepID=A0A0E9NLI7_SAICN|nr:hypothetical protein G7K_4868-t1 [Saitoella complicata NRRL Y-17804]